jgi:hypothetical protein
MARDAQEQSGLSMIRLVFIYTMLLAQTILADDALTTNT